MSASSPTSSTRKSHQRPTILQSGSTEGTTFAKPKPIRATLPPAFVPKRASHPILHSSSNTPPPPLRQPICVGIEQYQCTTNGLYFQILWVKFDNGPEYFTKWSHWSRVNQRHALMFMESCMLQKMNA